MRKVKKTKDLTLMNRNLQTFSSSSSFFRAKNHIQTKEEASPFFRPATSSVQLKTQSDIIQKEDEEEAPINDRRDLDFDYDLDFNRPGLGLSWERGEFSGNVLGGVENPGALLGFGGRPSTFLDFNLSNDCNRTFQNLSFGISHQQGDDGRFFSARGNRTSFSLGGGLRFGNFTVNPSASLDVGGGSAPNVGFLINVIRNASTQIPDECKRQIRQILPPPFRREIEDDITTDQITFPTPTPRVAPMRINFFYDSTIWRPESNSTIQMLTGFLTHLPGSRVILSGHASLEGSEDYNQSLSDRRAQAVKDWLVMGGIDESRIQTQGLGESSPIALEPNVPASLDPSTEEVRTQNRRVEAFLFDTSGNFVPDLTLQGGFGTMPQGNMGSLFRDGVATPGD